MTRRLLFIAGLAISGVAYGAPFADPTRPPRLDGDKAGPVSSGPRLESVLIAPDRRVAVISGQQVTVGSRISDGEVVRITEREVLIRRPSGEQSLKLFSGGEKRAAPAAKGGR